MLDSNRGVSERKNDRDPKMNNRKVDEEELIYLERGTGDTGSEKRSLWWSLLITLGSQLKGTKRTIFLSFCFFFFLLLCSLPDHIQYSIYSEKYAILKVGL